MSKESRVGYVSGPAVLEIAAQVYDAHQVPICTAQDASRIVSHAATAVMIIEKNSIWTRLVEDGYSITHRTILMCGNGYPGSTIRLLFARLCRQLDLPVFVLADNDPAGFDFYFLLARGGIRRPHAEMAIPSARFIGLRTEDAGAFGLSPLVQIDLSRSEQQHLADIERRKWVQNAAGWPDQLREMKRRGTKVELEAFCILGASALGEVYLPERLKSGEFLTAPSTARAPT